MEYKMGWIRQQRDARDYSVDNPEIKPLLAMVKAPAKLPKSVDLRANCTDITDQMQLGSCTANALAGLVGYFIKTSFKKTFTPSRLFTYYMTRRLESFPTDQDTGATIRGTMGSLAQFGVPPEADWPYDDYLNAFKIAPDLYSSLRAQNYKGSKYALIDQPGMTRAQVLTAIKTQLAANIPIEFGTAVYERIFSVGADGKIPYPAKGEQPAGGHAMVAVGYDDKMTIGSSKGAFLVRNSWGTGWGMNGYGWLPYDYLLKLPDDQYASDWWILLNSSWIDPSMFQFL